MISATKQKQVVIALGGLTVVLIAAIAWVEAAHRPRELMIPVIDLTCKGCESSLNEKLAELPGVIEVTASHTDKQVRLLVSGWSGPEPEMIEAAIRRAGYTVVETEEN